MEKLNIAEILENCPKGMKLYSPIFGDVYLDKIRPHLAIVVTTDTEQGEIKEEFLYDGRYGMNGECMLFPSKEQRDWSKFQKPFKDGDIVFYNDTIAIFKEWGDETLFRTYVTKYLCNDSVIDPNVPLFGKRVRKEIRFATEKEKQKLFDAIKDNGCRWNPETKTLEKLIVPKFKVGDRIKQIGSPRYYIIKTIEFDRYILHNNQFIRFTDEYIYELVPNKFDIITLKPFDKVLVRTKTFTPVWTIDFYDGYNPNVGGSFTPFGVSGGKYFQQCIPYKGNEYLRGTTHDCAEYYKTWK